MATPTEREAGYAHDATGHEDHMATGGGALGALVEASHYSVPDALPAVTDECSRLMGAQGATVFLVDLDQAALVALGEGRGEDLSIDGTVAGRAFRLIDVIESQPGDGSVVLWVPMVDGTERVGVLQLSYPSGRAPDDLGEVRAFAGLVAELVIAKSAYGDYFDVARRREPVTVGADLLWQLLPPLTFGTEDVVISAAFLPTASLGGDAFDYGVDAANARVAIFDAVGHDLRAGLIATTAVAAYRNSRRSGLGLGDTAHRIGTEIDTHFDSNAFATGIVLSLATESGAISWCVAGHPAPLLLRKGEVVKALERGHGMPFGLGPASAVMRDALEPGDRVLLYTDGVTEARDANGEFFGLETLVDLVGRSGTAHPPPETMRRLMHRIASHNDGPLRDDATAVMVEWRGPGTGQLRV
jgi:serine phosphatase RsbU (regulator of sigma subunit)